MSVTTPVISGTVVLNRKRGNIRGQVTRISNALKSKLGPKELDLKLNSLQVLKKKTDELRNEAYSIISDEDLGDFENSLTEIEEQLEAIEFHHPFDSESDAVALRDAIDNLGKKDDQLIKILGNRTNEQRKRIMETYKSMFEQDLKDRLLFKLTGNFKRTVELLLMPLAEYYAKLLRKAIYGPGKDEDLLLEILYTISNVQIAQIKEIYYCKFGKSLEDSIQEDCHSHFKNMLLLICKAERNEGVVSLDKVRNDAESLFEAGEARWEMDDAAYNTLFASESYEHLRFVFQEYEDITGRTLTEAIESETSGSMRKSLLTIVRCVENTPAYFARKLYRVLKGSNKDEKSLIRIVVSRCEIDMVFIKTEYQKRFKEPLEDAIKGDDPENFEKLLVELVTLDK